MFVIKDSLIEDKDVACSIDGEAVAMRTSQACIVNVCLTRRRERPDVTSKWFPALIDTGHSYYFTISDRHMKAFVGRSFNDFAWCGRIQCTNANGTTDTELDLRQGDLWLQSNVSGSEPLLIQMPRGFVCFENGGPPIPLLGRRGLAAIGLQLVVDYHSSRFSIVRRPTDRFAKWLVKKGKITEANRIDALCQQTRTSVPLESISILRQTERLVRVFQTECWVGSVGKAVIDVGKELGMVVDEDAVILDEYRRRVSTPIGQILVQMGCITDEQLKQLLVEYEQLRAQWQRAAEIRV